jgi:hypothetical protein
MISKEHAAIYALNSTVVSIDGSTAYDANGNVITYDTAAVTARAKLEELREERNRLLSETDWWASSDLTMTAEQTSYRQALRDITDNYSDLATVVWPTKP